MNRLQMLRLASFCAAALTLTTCALAQWPKRYDHLAKDDIAECVARDKFGNVFVAGTVSQSGGVKKDVVVTSYTAGGDLRSGWPRTYNGPIDGDDFAAAIHVDDSGHVYVAGTSWGGDPNYEPNPGTGWDIFIWKLDTAGNHLWPTSGGEANQFEFDTFGAIRTVTNNHEGYILDEADPEIGVKVDMAVREAANIEDRIIVVTACGQTGPTGGQTYWWHTIAFVQHSTNPPARKSGWPVKWPEHTSRRIFPEAVAIQSDNSIYVTGLGYNTGENPLQYFTTIRYKATGTNAGSGGAVVHWHDDWNAGGKESSGRDIVLNPDGDAYATGHVRPNTNIDYGTVRIEREWNGSDELPRAIWDNDGNKDEACRIDLTYEVESSAIKVYATVTGKTNDVGDEIDIGTVRYDDYLNEEWAALYGENNNLDDYGMMIVGAGAGNTYVIGTKGTDYVLIGYRRDGSERFTPLIYDNTYGKDEGRALAMAGAGHVRATGQSKGQSSLQDFATIEKTQSLSIAEPHSDYASIGFHLSGDLSALYAADETSPYRIYQRTAADEIPPEKLVVEFFAESPISAGSDPSEICVRYEGKCSVSNIKLKIEIYNWLNHLLGVA